MITRSKNYPTTEDPNEKDKTLKVKKDRTKDVKTTIPINPAEDHPTQRNPTKLQKQMQKHQGTREGTRQGTKPPN